MNPVDMGIAAAGVFCVARGFFRGFIREIASIAGILGGLFLAWAYFEEAAAFIKAAFPVLAYSKILGFAGIFLGVVAAASLSGAAIRRLARAVSLGAMDRAMGGLLGTMKGILAVWVALSAMILFLPGGPGMVRDSRLAPHVFNVSEKAFEMFSGSFGGAFQEKIEAVKKAWEAGAGARGKK